jgi:uncharacterized membrane protein YfcA
MSFLLIGLAAGVLAGLFGIGGGVLIVPALIVISRFSPARATGSSLAALLLPVGALGAWEYYRRGDVDVRAAALIALGLVAGAWVGAHWGVGLPARVLQRSFSVFLVAIAIHLWWTA